MSSRLPGTQPVLAIELGDDLVFLALDVVAGDVEPAPEELQRLRGLAHADPQTRRPGRGPRASRAGAAGS